MIISALGPNLFCGKKNSVTTDNSTVSSSKKTYKNIGLSGGLALAFLGTSVVANIAHARKTQNIFSALALASALVHVQSIAIKNNKKLNYNA